MSDAPSRPDVAIILHDLRGGGAERAMLRLAGGIAAAGRTVDLVLVQAKGDYLDQVSPAVRLINLNRGSVAGAIPAMARYLSETKPRALLAALTHVNIAALAGAAMARYRGRVVISERNQISEMAKTARGVRDKLTYFLARKLYRRADLVVAVSAGVAEDTRRFARLAHDKVVFAHNPVFDDKLLSRAEAKPDHAWLSDGGLPIILAVGRLGPQKGFDTLIAAFAQLRKRTPSRLLILGEGPDRLALEAQIADLGLEASVRLPGFCENPFAAMARADVFVLSSRWEGFPNALAEAIALGTPCVATDCPSGPREILDDGRFGSLVAVDDIQALSVAIENTLRNPPSRDAIRAHGRGFSVVAATARYLDILGV